MKLLVICIAIILIIMATRRGYRRGLSTEIRMFVDVLVATICLILIILLRRSVGEHTYGTVIIVAGALVILGIGWKFVKLISSPLSGFKQLKPIRFIDSLAGALAGCIEGAGLAWVIIWTLEKCDILTSGMIGMLNI